MVDLPTAATTETLIVSDLHLGIPAARPRELLGLLEEWRFQRLILLGDVLHDYGFRNFCADTWALLYHLRRLAADSAIEIVWIKGNHDRELSPIVAMLTGIRMRESFRWTCGERRYLALHGDRFDRFVTCNRRVSRLISRGYGFCQRRLSRHGRWPTVLDRMHGRLSDLGEQVAVRAARFARRRSADVVVCGHTHEPIHRRFAGAPDVDYYNAGSWVGGSTTFLAVDARGVRLERQLCGAA